MQKRKGKALVWLRNDLRIKDHASFYHATQKHEKVIAFYSFDPLHYRDTLWGFKKTEAFRAQFLLETLAQLQKDLENHNISLVISQEDPAKGIQELIKEHTITDLYLQKEWTKEEREREREVLTKLSDNIFVHTHYDQFLFHPEDVPMEIDQLPEVFTVFRKKCEKYKLTEEVGEVARIIARRYGEQSEKDSDKNKDLGEELADVLFVLLCLANQTGTDLQAAFNQKLDLKTKRDHDRHHKNKKLK